MSLTRRRFLGWTAAGAAIHGLGLSAVPGSRRPRDPGHDRILVILQLSGGNDGLSTVVPYADDAYQKARNRTRIAEKEVLRLDDQVGLHPNLKGLRKLWDAGHAAIVQGAGYPKPNRSHFESMDIWHAADPRGRLGGHGWVGRLADAAFQGSTDPNLVIHVGGSVPFALHSTSHPAIAFSTPSAYKWVGAKDDAEALEAAAPVCEHESPAAVGRDRALRRLREVLHKAQESSAVVRDAVASFKPAATYPGDRFGASLATVSALIAGGLSTRIFSVETGGFDTHTDQRGRHDGLMQRLDAGLAAFFADLGSRGLAGRVVLLAFSEFGRRVKENGSGGTDHGTAGPVFVLGPEVKGGLYGAPPALGATENGDLVHTVDFRRVYATLAGAWMGVDARTVLPGEWEKLAFL